MEQSDFNRLMDGWVAYIAGGTAGAANSKTKLANTGDVIPRYSGGVQVPSNDGNPTTGMDWAIGSLTGLAQRVESTVNEINDKVDELLPSGPDS